jgi:hypothetical protein
MEISQAKTTRKCIFISRVLTVPAFKCFAFEVGLEKKDEIIQQK